MIFHQLIIINQDNKVLIKIILKKKILGDNINKKNS